ncbi:FHA domain-containing protein [Saccharothrix sp. NRRL B-16314]|uniref:FHA domain-containing protein n=1 Tax=Saccharothrix sp. NRRL B-16314 TaxID=1463825 RepID=UPI000AD3BD3E|nr:FHA domain-containing protein [Saccharothrix sp. NRRL B-16314]
MEPKVEHSGGLLLPRGHDSLTRGVARAVPGSVHALALGGGYAVGPRDGRTVYFGRNRPLVHVCLGEDDQQVSRRHGELTHHQGRWWLRNTGLRPIRLPGSQWLFAEEGAIPLAEGYTPVHVPGSRDREHLLEVYVSGSDGDQPRSRHSADTDPPRPYALTPDEKVMLVALGRNYLLREPNPKPLTWKEAALRLAELQPDAGWTAKKLERRVSVVRDRLSRRGVHGLTREEVGEPVGNALNDNLIRELVRSTALTPKDLDLVD